MRRCSHAASILVFALGFAVTGCGRKAKLSAPPRPGVPPRAAQPTPAPPLPSAARVEIPKDAGPSIRIGLTTAAHAARVGATGDFYMVEKKPEATRQRLRGEHRIEAENGTGEAREIYRVQFIALANAAAAEELARSLEDRLRVPCVTRRSAGSRLTTVRAGEFKTREEAERFATGPLAAAGHAGGFVVRESAAARTGGGPRAAMRGPNNFFQVSLAGYLVFPASPADHVRYDGKPYRGVLDVSLNGQGRLTVVNQLGVEEYLFGVVPAEISPTTYPDPAALEAQAIAARTYALRNIGRFRAEGFDLTSDDRSQVYRGVSIEKAATSKAVHDTLGLALYHAGNLIEAMYASTCGGRTEDFANVFDRPAVPYLVGVACTVESAAVEAAAMRLRGTRAVGDILTASDGTIASRNLALASVLGLSDLADAVALEAPAEKGEIRRWVARARARAADAAEAAAPHDVATRAGFLRYAAESVFGAAEIASRITPADAAYYLANLHDGSEVPEESRPAVAFLMQRGLWSPQPDNFARPRDPVRRVDALSWLARWVEASREALRSGNLQRVEGSSLLVKSGSRTQKLPLAGDVRLFRADGGRSIAVDELRVLGNERIKLHVGSDGKVDFLEVELSPAGASSDRFSPQASWQTTLPRRAISEKLQPLAPTAGEIVDLEPARLGTSGRAVQIRVEGTRGSVLLNGYRVRQALGLRDTLFTLRRNRAADGAIESLTFDGRGWGHGVGLCQTGAVGMARAGRTYEQILKTYYTGVDLRRAY